jgi:pimeloyl-ACP methyl ester carboxylesterase
MTATARGLHRRLSFRALGYFRPCSVLAGTYFDKIAAPYKKIVWFEQSTHNPPFEEPEKFNRVLIDEVLPLATAR